MPSEKLEEIRLMMKNNFFWKQTPAVRSEEAWGSHPHVQESSFVPRKVCLLSVTDNES